MRDHNPQLEFVSALDALGKFVRSLPSESRTPQSGEALGQLQASLTKLGDALRQESLERHARFQELLNLARKHEQAGHVFNDLLLQVFAAYTRNEPDEMLKHFRTFQRVVGELNAPLPPRDEIRAELEAKFSTAKS